MSERNIAIVNEINDAFTRNDIDGFLAHCTEDLYWNMAGDSEHTGKSSIREWMKQMEGHEPPKFSVDAIFGDGDHVACHGEMTMKNADGNEGKYSYCDVYTFKGDKVSELRSYVVAHKTEDKNASASA
ncbi:MAG: nuclear transport factor 2 family protein [Pyrinomonadaceae bacterium]